MNTFTNFRRWFSRSTFGPSNYSSIPAGFHPYDEEPVARYDPVTTKDHANCNAQGTQDISVVAESEMPAWQSILALYPDLTAAEGFDRAKLARFISDDGTNAGVDYLLSIFEHDA
ncbi:protein of unknown function [Taphrina deformans PYCC 5710]|uniref:Uncharacterized protein n=1 Tax=Taphrina deformans (strain PYCC 5710 / ATCC 11124 / CBS 356.35 / IMI 108563 / JCM 9778 / NBRC 8474) TaxID=1097556 RepID=R4XAA3_TAPDE|nr:protein of unknown function [Taphrina deformans PYCC 5710]|eukprot:CCG82442.1 protein of unknown function [Taphrina deformans PYCC 5710]